MIILGEGRRYIMSRCVGLALALVVLMGTNDDDASRNEYARLEGVWRFALVEVEGVKQRDAPFETNKLIVSKNGRYLILQGPRMTRGVIKLDPSKTPKHYDVTITNGPSKGLKASGVYEIDGDSYKLCLPFRGKERPAALVSTPGSGCLFYVFNREKADVTDALIAAGRQELAGTWQAVSYALNGNTATEEDMKKIQLVIHADGKTTARNEGKVFIASTTTIDPTQEPMTMDLTYTDGGPKGTNSLGIYQIEDKILTICRAAAGQARPTEFSSTPGSGQTLMTYKREATPGTKKADQ
jgi:uncharacterized protein (TIGR03067 family)